MSGEATMAVRVGARLRALRGERRLTLAEVAETTGLSVSYLSAMEKGQNLPSLPTLARLTEAYGVSIPSVLAGESQPHVRQGRVPARPGVVPVSHPSLQLDAATVRHGRGTSGAAPVRLGDRDVFVYVLGGALTVEVDGESITLQSGDALDAAAPAAVTWRAARAATAVWVSCPVTSGP